MNELKAYFVAEDLVPMNTNEAYSATMDDSKRVVVTAENKRVRDTAIVERSRSTTMQEPDTINAGNKVYCRVIVCTSKILYFVVTHQKVELNEAYTIIHNISALDEPQDGTYSPVQIKTRRTETGKISVT